MSDNPTPREAIARYFADGDQDVSAYLHDGDNLIAALDQAGYVIVPKEPTEAMSQRGVQTGVLDCRCQNGSERQAEAIYSAMITAAEDGK